MHPPSKIEMPAVRHGSSSGFRLHMIEPRIEEVRLQPIVNRQERIIGYETLARFDMDEFDGSVEDAVGRFPLGVLGRLTSELLLGLRVRCLLDENYAIQMDLRKPARTAVWHFVNVEKLSLTDPAVVNELIETAADLHNSGARLVVEVTERPVATANQFRSYLKGLMRLKQEDVLVALDDYDIEGPAHWELDLGLCDVVKLDIPSLGIVMDDDDAFMAARYSALAEKLFGIIHRYRVELLAEKVESDWQYEVVKGLPFSLFQGYRFGRPERI